MIDIITSLRENGLKATPQRLAIYNYLINTKAHPSVETIYNDLHIDYPNMSLATIYKTLAMLRDVGLILEFNTGEDSFRYDANVEPHAHIICSKCHKVVDFYSEVMADGVVDAVERETGFKINNRQTYFIGVCDECDD